MLVFEEAAWAAQACVFGPSLPCDDAAGALRRTITIVATPVTLPVTVVRRLVSATATAGYATVGGMFGAAERIAGTPMCFSSARQSQAQQQATEQVFVLCETKCSSLDILVLLQHNTQHECVGADALR